jgi:hypothetical protein
MYTIDARVWINSFDGREQGHEISRQLIELFRDNNIAVIVPNLLFSQLPLPKEKRLVSVL